MPYHPPKGSGRKGHQRLHRPCGPAKWRLGRPENAGSSLHFPVFHQPGSRACLRAHPPGAGCSTLLTHHSLWGRLLKHLQEIAIAASSFLLGATIYLTGCYSYSGFHCNPRPRVMRACLNLLARSSCTFEVRMVCLQSRCEDRTTSYPF